MMTMMIMIAPPPSSRPPWRPNFDNHYHNLEQNEDLDQENWFTLANCEPKRLAQQRK